MEYTLIYNDLVTGKKQVGILLYPTQQMAQYVADEANKAPEISDNYYTVAPYTHT